MLSKPISEVAAEYNPDDRCTPSYVRVPASYPKIKSTGRTPLGEQVLNDSWVSIISGSEDYSFKVCGQRAIGQAAGPVRCCCLAVNVLLPAAGCEPWYLW